MNYYNWTPVIRYICIRTLTNYVVVKQDQMSNRYDSILLNLVEWATDSPISYWYFGGQYLGHPIYVDEPKTCMIRPQHGFWHRDSFFSHIQSEILQYFLPRQQSNSKQGFIFLFIFVNCFIRF